MKKVIGLIVMAMMIVLPMGVHAASFSSEIYPIAEDESGATYEVTFTIGSGTKFTQIGGTLELIGVSLESITTDNSALVNESSGTNLLFNSASGGVLAPGTYKFTVVVKKIDPANCSVKWTPCTIDEGQNTPICDYKPVVPTKAICKIVGNKYFGKNGTEVTKEVYESECINNPKTGNFMPYIVLGAGIMLAVVVFTVSRKNNKLYKI